MGGSAESLLGFMVRKNGRRPGPPGTCAYDRLDGWAPQRGR
jgi:hypothetical protein